MCSVLELKALVCKIFFSLLCLILFTSILQLEVEHRIYLHKYTKRAYRRDGTSLRSAKVSDPSWSVRSSLNNLVTRALQSLHWG
jgi:hypothetical protein